MNTLKQDMTELADHLAYLRVSFDNLRHVPEVRAHIEKLAFWEMLVRALAEER